MVFYTRRKADAPCEGHPHLGAIERERADWSIVKILAVLVGFIAFGLWYYVKDKELASSQNTSAQTTGVQSQEVPSANDPRREPAPPRPD